MLRQLTPIPPVFYGIDPKFHRVSGITPPFFFASDRNWNRRDGTKENTVGEEWSISS